MRVPVGSFVIGKQEKKYLNQVIDSSRISYGPLSRKFENAFAKEHGCRSAVFCNSGTSALHIALAALKEKYGWSDGDEVLVPSVTFIATSNVVIHNNMKPVFVDVDPFTYNINPRLIEAKITKRTRAIIPVHLMGLPADMDLILHIAKCNKLKIIEDSCETVFAKYRGRPVGSFGDIACFSTYVAHYIITGVGGLATTNDPDLAIRLRSLMNHGRDSVYLNIDDKGPEVAAGRFRFVSVGHSFRATEFEAALGLAQIERKKELIKARLSIARRLTAGLKDIAQLQRPTVPDDRDHVFMLYPIVLRCGDKKPLVDYLEKKGIETRDLMPLINQPIYKKLYGDLQSRYPVASWLDRGGFYIGCHPYMSDQVDYVVKTIRGFFK